MIMMKKLFKRLFRKKPKPDPFAKVKDELLKSVTEEKPYTFNYNLTFANRRTVGVCALSGDKLYMLEEGGEVKAVELSKLSEVKFVSLWGCVALETVNEDGEAELCRADMTKDAFIRYLGANGVSIFQYDDEQEFIEEMNNA